MFVIVGSACNFNCASIGCFEKGPFDFQGQAVKPRKVQRLNLSCPVILVAFIVQSMVVPFFSMEIPVELLFLPLEFLMTTDIGCVVL